MSLVRKTPSLASQLSEGRDENDDLDSPYSPKSCTYFPKLKIRTSASIETGNVTTHVVHDEMAITQSRSNCSSVGSSLSVLSELRAQIRKQLKQNGTNVNHNDADKYGDGDQTPVIDPVPQLILHELFYTGADLNNLLQQQDWSGRSSVYLALGGLSEFAVHCIAGRHKKVKQMLENNSVKKGKSLKSLTQLLEKRETALRLTPLMLVVAAATRMSEEKGYDNGSKSCRLPTIVDGREGNYGEREEVVEVVIGGNANSWESNQLKVIKLLLQYGARPDAKDVSGKTIVHYGAGVDATDMTLTAVDMCIKAAKTSFLFGKEVQLRNLEGSKKESKLNGKRGVAQGYVVDTGCRIVYLFGQKTEVMLRPNKMRLVKKIQGVQPPKLCDVQDRMGRVPLLELYDSNRFDVAEFLLHKHKASIDVKDWNKKTLREIAMTQGISHKGNLVVPLIHAAAMRQIRCKAKEVENKCSQCGKPGTPIDPLRVCQPCMSVRFCSNDCQLVHWRGGHMYECKHLSRERNMFVLIDQVLDIQSNGSGLGKSCKGAFQKPSKVDYDQLFTVKINNFEEEEILKIHDKSNECQFYISSEQESYDDILDRLHSHSETAGTKMYVSASFDASGACKLFINQTKMKTW